MILDQLEHASSYYSLGERFIRGFQFLQRREFERLGEGRHEILGTDLFAMVQSYDAKPIEQGKWEAHRTYADIQYIASGREMIGIAPLDQMTVTEAYDEARDVAFFTGSGQMFTLSAGGFAIFLPHDAHMPSLHVERPERVFKVVMKVRLS